MVNVSTMEGFRQDLPGKTLWPDTERLKETFSGQGECFFQSHSRERLMSLS